MQSRAEVVALRQGDAVAFAASPPGAGTRAYHVNLRHRVAGASGTHTVGVIFP